MTSQLTTMPVVLNSLTIDKHLNTHLALHIIDFICLISPKISHFTNVFITGNQQSYTAPMNTITLTRE